MAHIEVIMGCMFSGKSTELIRRLRRHRAINEKILVINSAKDTRSSDDVIKTHNWETFACMKITDLTTALNFIKNDRYAVVAIDEAQFFTGLREFVQNISTHVKRIIIAGLDGDFLQRPFGEIFQVLPMADEVIKLHALCMVCKNGTPAPFTKRFCEDTTTQEIVGDHDIYKAVCRKCLDTV
jgi:thymidine kinase